MSCRRRLDGIFLPARQRFTIPLPEQVGYAPGADQFAGSHPYDLALTARALYLVNGNDQLWSAPLRTAPRPGH
jgi:hypothetical protein